MTEELNKQETEQEETTATETVEETETVVAEEQTTEEATAEETAETLTHVFTGEVEGDVYTYDQLASPSDEYTDDEYNEMMGMYENTLNQIEEKKLLQVVWHLLMTNMLLSILDLNQKDNRSKRIPKFCT